MYEDPYYSHHATRSLTRPVALAGFIGSGAAAVGHAVTARTGIPLVDLLRWVEHARGKSIANLVLHEGECALRDQEREGLRRALTQGPHPLVVLGHGTLLSPHCRTLLAEHQAMLVYLRAPLATLAERARDQLSKVRTKHAPYFTELSDGAADLEALFAARLPGYLDAAVTIDLADLNQHSLAEAVLRALPVAQAPHAAR